MAIVLKMARPSSFSTHEDALPDPMLLEAGDQVAIVDNAFKGLVAYVYTVERTTRTQIVLQGSPTRYSRADGSAIGSGSASRKLMHVGHPAVLAAKQAEVLRRLKDKAAEVLGEKMTTSADRIRAARSLQTYARQAAERIELLDQQMAENQVEIDALRAEGSAEE